jgi:hypothetical protein
VVWEEEWVAVAVGDVAWEEVWAVAAGGAAVWVLVIIPQRQYQKQFPSHPKALANRKNLGSLRSKQRLWARRCKNSRSEFVNWERKEEPEVVIAGFSAVSESVLGRTDRRGETCC